MTDHEEIDKLTASWRNSIRGLYEVETDDKGKKMIYACLDAMRDMHTFYRRVVVDLEWEMIETRLLYDWERDMLKRSLRATNEIDLMINERSAL